MEGVIVKELNKFADQRGWLAEIFRQDETEFTPQMGYVSVTKPGVIRGPHEHKDQSDCFIFLGPGTFEVHLWDRRVGSTTEGEHLVITAGEAKPSMVIVPPGVVHGYKCTSEQDGYCINLPDRLYRGENKKNEVDEIRWEIDPASPYKIA